jgi:peptidoglycan/xylan/chitin deacetylase (PgdA/CDA1 family)
MLPRATFAVLLACCSLAAAEQPAAATQPEDGGARVSVLGYHDFSESGPETAMRINTTKFRRQMELIGQLGIQVISLDDFIAWKNGEKEIPEKSILLTIDDGWKSVYTDAFPILRELGLPFTLYLYKNYVDGGNKALTSAMIREMIAAGATIGSHSVSHPYPASVRKAMAKGPEAYDAYLRNEMGESRRFLEARFKVPVNTYAFPGGFHTDEMLKLGTDLGYSHMFTVQPGKVTRSTPDDRIPRYMILGNYDRIFEFATTFRNAGEVPVEPEGAVAGLLQATPQPVIPDAGAVINSRLPEIVADLSEVRDIDPASLVMKVSGYGEVPAAYTEKTGKFAWQVKRPLRHTTTQVSVSWKDKNGKAPEKPLRWSFQIDRASAYLPDGE